MSAINARLAKCYKVAMTERNSVYSFVVRIKMLVDDLRIHLVFSTESFFKKVF